MKNKFILGIVISLNITMLFTSCFKEDTGVRTTLSFENEMNNYLNRYNENDSYSFSSEYVDLGLSVCWATCNLGSEIPEGYGNYYAWGEISRKYNGNYDAEHYKYLESMTRLYGSQYRYEFKKYQPSVDNLLELLYVDDAVYWALGEKWRIPTVEEFQELIDNCSVEWTSINTFFGYNFTSKIPGFTDKSIFIPVAGYLASGDFKSRNEFGQYWSSTLGSDKKNAFGLKLSSSEVCVSDSYFRFYGRPIRPVLGERKTVKVSKVSINKTSIDVVPSCTENLEATISPQNATHQIVYWTTSDSSIATVSQEGVVTAVNLGQATISAIIDGVKAECAVSVAFPENQTEAVDMGFSVKWASQNLGAKYPEDYGNQYAWGETSPKTSDFDLEHYLWYDTSKSVFTKYTGPEGDGLTRLELCDDAAHVNSGGKMRMPTYSEMAELASNCNVNEVLLYGRTYIKLTSRKNGASILLPITSGIWGYWTSVLFYPTSVYFAPYNENYAFAFQKYGTLSGTKYDADNGFTRYRGGFIRPVFE